jgi:predicted transcriptional regulator
MMSSLRRINFSGGKLSMNELQNLTARIATGYLKFNQVAPADLGAVISAVATALEAVGREPTASVSAAEPMAVEASALPTKAQIRKSIQTDHLISFLDGKPYRLLKKHLSKNGFTPEEYKERFKLGHDYPLVAPSYSQARSAMAISLGFGQKPKPAPEAAPAAAEPAPAAVKTPRAPKVAKPAEAAPKAPRAAKARPRNL